MPSRSADESDADTFPHAYDGEMTRLKSVALWGLLLLVALGGPLSAIGRGGPGVTVTVDPPEHQFPGGESVVTANVTPAAAGSGGCGCAGDSSIPIDDVAVAWGPYGTQPQSKPMERVGDNELRATVPFSGNSTTQDITWHVTVTVTDANGQHAAMSQDVIVRHGEFPPPPW